MTVCTELHTNRKFYDNKKHQSTYYAASLQQSQETIVLYYIAIFAVIC